jgi:hypothetical protein
MGSGEITAIVVGVLICSAVIAWMAWRLCKSVERAERDPKYLRRRLLRMGLLYVFVVVFAVVEVVTGKQPKALLLGLPIAVLLAWRFLKAAVNVRS